MMTRRQANAGILAVAALAAAAPASAITEELKPRDLPPPRSEGGQSLTAALKLRRSTREYSDRPLPAQVLSDLLWAAFGINRPASGDRTERHVEPHRLVALDRRWYLVAYDVTRNDWRSFRLDRVADVPQPTGARFRPRTLPAKDAAEFVRRNITAPGARQVTVIIEASAAVIRERIGKWAEIAEEGPGRCRVTMTPENLDWPAIAVGVVGADFQVIDPPELTEHIRDWAARFTRATA